MEALIIDDSRVLRRLLGDMLRHIGFEVREANNGREGMEQLRLRPMPDVVLVDWNMPVMNGLQFVEAVRSQDEFSQLPIMMVTSETEFARVETAITAGANEYVMKPFDQDVIAEKLQLLGF